MKNLMTRKIVLGLLMVLVLAFGVLGSADAIDRLTRNSGDLQTVTAGRDYQIRFTVGLQSPKRGSEYTDYRQTPSGKITVDVSEKTNKTAYHQPAEAGTTETYAQQVNYDLAHDYDQESITISGGIYQEGREP